MTKLLRSLPAEINITLGMVAATLLLALIFDLPLIYPTSNRASHVGIHYLFPLIGVGIWGIFAFFGQKRRLAQTFLIALPCYAIVLVAHFNVKLWIPHINPWMFDKSYWAIDQALRPLVDASFAASDAVSSVVAHDSNFYMIGFIALFYISFCYHAFRTPDKFRELFLAALLLQVIGSFAYLVAPAVGPFIYEAGNNPMVTTGQWMMHGFFEKSVAGGPEFLAKYGGASFTGGLAAMPSLHTAGGFLFLMFAWKHGRVLVPLYSFIMIFILFTAIATRWHYLIDIPFGALIAWVCIKWAERIVRVDAPATASVPDTVPAGAVAA